MSSQHNTPNSISSVSVPISNAHNNSSGSGSGSEELLEAAYKLKLKKRNELLQKIHQTRARKAALKAQNASAAQLKTLWMHRYNQNVSRRALALSNYTREQRKLDELQSDFDKLEKVNMNVLQDVFHIWHRNHGTYATINGLRLGMSMTINGYGHGHGHGPHSGSPSGSGSGSNESDSQAKVNMNMSINSFWNNSSVQNNNKSNATQSAAADNSNASANANINDLKVQVTVTVPWHEINAAVGMVGLLIHTLQSKLLIHTCSRYMIQPRGSTTRVLSRKTKQEWDLFHQPAAFQFFAKRNWNAALNILGYCLLEIVSEVDRIRAEIIRQVQSKSKIQPEGAGESESEGQGEGQGGSGSGSGSESQ